MNKHTSAKQGISQRIARPLLLLALLVSPAAWAQVINGGFEASLAPWTATFAGANHDAATRSLSGTVVPHTGSYFLGVYDNDGVGRVSQPINTVAGASYTVSAWLTSQTDSPSNLGSIRLGAANSPVTCVVVLTTWTQCIGTFVASGASESLDLLFETQDGLGAVMFDDVTVTLAGAPPVSSVQPVPTLSQWALMILAAAMGALGLRRLRRRG